MPMPQLPPSSRLALSSVLAPFSLLAASLLAVSPASAKPPNIVILLADDWGFTDVGAFGSEIATPHIDALATAGVRFSNFHVAGSCAPTRAMLQTGVSHHRAGLGNMPETIPPAHQNQPGYETQINNRVLTIAEHLAAAGYRSYFTGKWHIGKDPGHLPTDRGYTHAFALSQSGADNFENKPNLLLYDRADWTEDGKPSALTGYSSTTLIDKTIAYIDSNTDKPFLASVNFLANHIPVQAPDADIARYQGRYAAGWDALRTARRAQAAAKGLVAENTPMVRMDTSPDWASLTAAEKSKQASAMAAYAGMATAMDREIGRLVTHLKARGDYQNTIFIFLSDNGPEAIDPLTIGTGVAGHISRLATAYYYNLAPDQQGRPGSFTAIGPAFASAAASPLRGYKFSASEGGLRVPLIITWPGNPDIARGTVAHAFTQVTDIVPTLLGLTGIAPQSAPTPVSGRSLVPLLTASASTAHPADESIGYELSGNAVLFQGDWKLVRNLPPYGDGQWHLYNIASDPGETQDQAAALPERFARMQADYSAYANGEGVLPMPAGYSAPRQIEANARANVLIPRLMALAWPVLGLAALIILFIGRRRLKKV